MSSPGLTDAQCWEALAALDAHGGNVTAASKALGLPRGTMLNRVDRAQARKLAAQTPVAAPPVREPLTTFEEAWAQWQREIGMWQERYAGPSEDIGDCCEHIAVLPDLHIPFHEPAMLAEFLAREKGADRCVCIGDFGDSYALSRFVKYERVPYAEEWAQATLVMQALSEAFPRVDIVLGNHDARLERQLRDRLTEDMVDAVRFLSGGVLCPITAIAKRYPNVYVAKHEARDGHSLDWCVEIGDAWFGHPEKWSRVPGSMMRGVEEWIADFEYEMRFKRYRLVMAGHTHQASWIPWRAGMLLCEAGCLCQLHGYQTNAKINGRPQRRGYWRLEQTNGITDLNSLKFHNFDWVEAVA